MHDPLETKNFRWLMESAADAMLIADATGRIRVANSGMERLFGYRRDELLALTVEDLIPERLRDTHAAERARYAQQPRRRPMGEGLQLHGRRKDGSEFPVDVSLSPLEGPEGLLVLATIHDISRRKEAERALAESEARLRAVVETAVDAIVVIDTRGTIEAFNPAAERMFGYCAAEAIGKNVALLMPSPYREEHDGYIRRFLATGERRIIGIGREVLGRRKDGSIFPIELAVSETRAGGRHFFTSIIHDISARKQAEERQAQLIQELQAANEELRNFAYVVSHDLKAPLRAIGSLADWLNTDYAERLDEEGREHLRLLMNRVRRMDALIEGILEYSRIGRVRETVAAVDLNELLREVIDLLHPPPHVRVTIETVLPTLRAERTRLAQVFQNLLSNAIKYLDKPEGDIRIGCAEEGEAWRFSVSDNGPGIEPRHHERIFLLFQTLQSRDRVEGTGVGLALVKKIVELYGGRVWLESTPSRGSTFFFTLPRTITEHTAKEAMA